MLCCVSVVLCSLVLCGLCLGGGILFSSRSSSWYVREVAVAVCEEAVRRRGGIVVPGSVAWVPGREASVPGVGSRRGFQEAWVPGVGSRQCPGVGSRQCPGVGSRRGFQAVSRRGF